MSILHEEEYRNCKIEIIHDEYGQNPRDWDNLGQMFCWHSRYDLGDEHDITLSDDVSEEIENEYEPLITKTLYLYDHSGLSMSTTPFQSRWDSGKVGFIIATEESLMQCYGLFNKDEITEEILEKASKLLDQEVKTYDNYLRGNCFGYSINNKDSCFGFIEDNYEYALTEAKLVIDSWIKTGYKAVSETALSEVFNSSTCISGSVDYVVNSVTKPRENCGPLAVFTNKEDALKFRRSDVILKVEYCQSELQELWYISNNRDTMWISSGKKILENGMWKIFRRVHFPDGTDFADWVKPIKIVEVN